MQKLLSLLLLSAMSCSYASQDNTRPDGGKLPEGFRFISRSESEVLDGTAKRQSFMSQWKTYQASTSRTDVSVVTNAAVVVHATQNGQQISITINPAPVSQESKE